LHTLTQSYRQNPTNLEFAVQVLATKIAALEGTESAVVSASGIAGVTATMLSLLNPGDHFITQAYDPSPPPYAV